MIITLHAIFVRFHLHLQLHFLIIFILILVSVLVIRIRGEEAVEESGSPVQERGPRVKRLASSASHDASTYKGKGAIS